MLINYQGNKRAQALYNREHANMSLLMLAYSFMLVTSHTIA